MVDSINAAAWNPDDLLMIRKAIESSIGYEGVNRMVLSQIRSWLITTAVDFIAKPSAMVSKELNQAGGKALLMNQIAKLYHLQGNFTEALKYQESAFSLDSTEFGPESEQAARDMNNLGHLLNLMNNFDSAKQYLERARAIRARVFGDDSAEVARVTYNIGEVLESQGKFDECIVMFQSSSNVLVKLKRNHEALKVFQGLGRVYRAKGDFKMSDIIFKTAMELGSDIVTHPDMALLLGTYAALLTDIDRFNEAKEMLERSRAIQIRNLGEKHPNVSDLDNNLARLQCRLGNYEDALKSQSSALEIDKLVFGEHDLSTARDHSNMGHLLNMLGRLEEAEEHLKQALSIRGQLLGTTNIIYARSLCNYANTEIQSGKFQTALQKLQQARQTIQTCAVDHPDLNEVDSLIGKCFYSKGQYEDAENCWKTAISKDTSPNSAKIDYMLQLAKCLTDAQKFDEAERNLITAEQLAEEVCKGLEQNFYQASILSGKARLLEAKGDLDEAICFQRKALEKSQFDTLEASLDLNNLGYLLTERPTSLETLDEGITLLRKAVNIRRGALGKTNPLTLRSNYNLGQALCQKLTIDNQVYEEGIQAVRFSVQHMEKGENAVHAMIARLGLSKILLMSPSKTSKSELDSILPLLEDERMKQLPSFLKLELSVLKSYIAKNDASLEAQVVEYREAGTAKGMKYDMNIPLFLILQARTTMNQDNAIKLLHEAQEYCEKMTLWTDHIYYKEIHRMKGNIHTS